MIIPCDIIAPFVLVPGLECVPSQISNHWRPKPQTLWNLV